MVSRERSILHLNVADFAVAVERIKDRSLSGKAVIVAPLHAARALVHDMSDEAYGDGVRKGMAVPQALRCCRSAHILPPRFDLYKRAMSAFISEVREYTPILESGREDGHLFLDVTGTYRLFGTPPDLGWRLRKKVHAKLGIEPIWSLGSNKLIAKVASRIVKPSGEYIVAAGEEEAFLAPLPLFLLPGFKTSEMERLTEFNISLVGHLAALDKNLLYSVFGSRGVVLHDLCRGIDVEPVCSCQQNAVVSREYILAEDSSDKNIIEGIIAALTVRIGMILRDRAITCSRLAVQLDYTDGIRITRQATGRRGVSDDFVLQEMAHQALARAWRRRTRVRGCRVQCDRLSRKSPQLGLFDDALMSGDKKSSLFAAMDNIRNRFGTDALRLGSQASLH